MTMVCNECAKYVTKNYFHCNICFQDNFDLCPECIATGIACLRKAQRLGHRILKYDGLVNETG